MVEGRIGLFGAMRSPALAPGPPPDRPPGGPAFTPPAESFLGLDS